MTAATTYGPSLIADHMSSRHSISKQKLAVKHLKERTAGIGLSFGPAIKQIVTVP